ncbi:glycoside hydrolase superfamily [Halenospora varia]|nr:glycoside hydrolase superfamily [Halenospora varia]
MSSSLRFVKLVSLWLTCGILVEASPFPLETRLNNGLARTPPMGWNSYNHYSCSPNETIIHSNAQALVDLGLKAKGYDTVTVDCGWTLPSRLANGTLTWNPALFPNGYFALGQFIHGLGLKFGVYSDGGVQMCMTGSPAQVGSLDAQTFQSWGADLLKYDNCYSDAATGYPNTAYTPSKSPKPNFEVMSAAVASLSRPMVFQVCDWGVDFPSAWAPALGNSWRVTNDIIPAYRTIPRILNQVVSQTDFAGPGQWLDLDMLEVGNNVFTQAEEQTHFSLWAILKSPLVIGGALKDAATSISASSLAILSNSDVISYNQDSLGVAASFKRRWTEKGYEVWAGPVSGGRTVVAVVNLLNSATTLTVDFPDIGIQKAASVKDIWNGVTFQNVLTSYTAKVAAHGTILLELGGTTASGTYSAQDATISTDKKTTTFSKIYAATTSKNYTAVLNFQTASGSASTISIGTTSYTLPANAKSLTATVSLTAGNTNTLSITSPISLASLAITSPPSTFYPSTSFSLIGSSTRTTCVTSLCQPVGSKIGYLTSTGSASLSLSAPSSSSPGSKFANIYFCNNDIAIATSWEYGTNTRNMTISVNGNVQRIEVPLSGRSSELYSPGLGWQDTGIFGVLLSGFVEGTNTVVVGNEGGDKGLVGYGADFVGVEVFW